MRFSYVLACIHQTVVITHPLKWAGIRIVMEYYPQTGRVLFKEFPVHDARLATSTFKRRGHVWQCEFTDHPPLAVMELERADLLAGKLGYAL